MALIQTAREIWRKYVTDGVPGSGANQPDKTAIVQWGTFLETMLGAGVPGLAYTTKTVLDGDLAHGANSTAIVYNETSSPDINGFYVKSGASGTGSWSRIGDLPNVIVPLTVTGGTGDAIIATAPETPTAPGLKLFLLTPTANNSGATTLAYNGQPALPIENAFHNALVGGELLTASPVLMLGNGTEFTLLVSTNVDASSILAAAVAAQAAAASSASAAATSAAALGSGAQGQIPASVPKTAAVTISIASPGVVTWNAHGLQTGSPVALTTTGALPTGLTACALSSTGALPAGGTIYYAINVNANTFRLATSVANAIAGTAINTSGGQSGTHTATANFLAPGVKGYVQESEIVLGSAVSIANQVATEITRLTLDPGTYDFEAQATFTTSGGAKASEYHATISTTAPPTVIGLPNKGGGAGDHVDFPINQSSVFNFKRRIIITAPGTVVYLSGYATFGSNGSNGSGALIGFGFLAAELK